MTDAGVVNLALNRLVDRFHPIRVILFGSRARNTHRHDSDLDLLVVMPDASDKRALAIQMRQELRDLPIAKDVLVSTPDEIRRRGDMLGSALRFALREGKVLFERS